MIAEQNQEFVNRRAVMRKCRWEYCGDPSAAVCQQSDDGCHDYYDELNLFDEVTRLRSLLTDVVAAADHMRDDWAGSDEPVKMTLWRELHSAAERSYDDVYPLGKWGVRGLAAEEQKQLDAARR